MESSSRLSRQLREAATTLDLGDSGMAEYRRLTALALHQRFACSMASLWRLSGVPGARTLRCVVAFSEDARLTATGVELSEHEFSGYFQALSAQGIYNCPDTLADPHLAGMVAGYLVPQRIRALPDAVFAVNGHTLGVLCLEQRDAPRAWTRADEVDLRRAASAISLTLSRQLLGTECATG